MKVPNTSWKIRKGPDWWDETAEDYFRGKRVLVVSLPGAFTPIWSSEQLPGLEDLYEKFKEKDIDDIYCLSVNDSFVMNAWAKDLNIEKVKNLMGVESSQEIWICLYLSQDKILVIVVGDMLW